MPDLMPCPVCGAAMKYWGDIKINGTIAPAYDCGGCGVWLPEPALQKLSHNARVAEAAVEYEKALSAPPSITRSHQEELAKKNLIAAVRAARDCRGKEDADHG